MAKLLEAQNLSVSFAGLKAISDFSIELDKKELVGIIGPNGAGKTTVFNLLTGVYRAESGDFFIEGKSMLGKPPHAVVHEGIARTFQNIRLFKDLSVADNVKAALCKKMSYSLADCIFQSALFRKEEKAADEMAMETLKEFGLESKAKAAAGSLPYGEQRKLEIARALATGAKVLLLDEPAAGMNNTETAELMEVIRRIRDIHGTAILLIEHDMGLVMGICERLVVLDYGKIAAVGTPYEISQNKAVIAAYIGED